MVKHQSAILGRYTQLWLDTRIWEDPYPVADGSGKIVAWMVHRRKDPTTVDQANQIRRSFPTIKSKN